MALDRVYRESTTHANASLPVCAGRGARPRFLSSNPCANVQTKSDRHQFRLEFWNKAFGCLASNDNSQHRLYDGHIYCAQTKCKRHTRSNEFHGILRRYSVFGCVSSVLAVNICDAVFSLYCFPVHFFAGAKERERAYIRSWIPSWINQNMYTHTQDKQCVREWQCGRKAKQNGPIHWQRYPPASGQYAYTKATWIHGTTEKPAFHENAKKGKNKHQI